MAAEPKPSDSPIDVDLVARLARILTEHGLAELDVEQDGARVRLVKPAPAPVQLVAAPAPAIAAPGAAPVVAAPAEPAPAEHPGVVPSPMVGTAYLASEPGAKAFVAVGDEVREGQTVLIIEAMKVMNPIPAPRSGRVTRIFIADAQPVEFGQPLLAIA